MHFLDTNIVIWLYEGKTDSLSEKIKKCINENELFISPIVKLELQYLYEIKRIYKKSKYVIQFLHDMIDLQIDDINFDLLIDASIDESWTRDPFDRLIVSHAKVRKANLLTKDREILKNYKKVIL